MTSLAVLAGAECSKSPAASLLALVAPGPHARSLAARCAQLLPTFYLQVHGWLERRSSRAEEGDA